MGVETGISWADHTFNPWMGCTKVSPACDGCYAEALMDKRYGRVQWGPHGERVRTSQSNWRQPIAWDRVAAKAGTRPFVFCASLADVFDNQVPAEWRRDLFDLIRATPNLVWLLLTKRPQNIVKMAEAAGGLPGNAALGATCEDQKRADMNVPSLLEAKAQLLPAFAFLSCEPLLGPINLHRIREASEFHFDALSRKVGISFRGIGLDWVITGGETDQGGHKARPTHPEWFRSLRDQCAAAGVAYQHKQNGEWAAYDQVGAGGWEFSRETGGRRFGRLTHHYDGDSACSLIGREFETRYPWGNGSTSPGAGPCMVRVGKSASGRLIDRIEHNARPEVPHVR